VQVADLRVRLVVVKQLDDYVDAEALLRDADAPEPPYWAHLWTGSRALARLVAAEIDCTGRRIVEVGCGLGLAGIVAALRGASVTLIDTVADAIHFARANAMLNRVEVTALQTDLRCPGLRGTFDVCLAADVTYDPSLQSALATFLADHLAPRGRAWCVESVRTHDLGFRLACARYGFHVGERQIFETEDGREVAVRLTQIEAPGG
jgi:predicted nicotinamide N-methyase